MTLFQDADGDPRAAPEKLADVLSWYGAVGDAVAGNPVGFCRRKASIATALCDAAVDSIEESRATYFAGLLHAIGSVGNEAYCKNGDLAPRFARSERWDVSPQGARIAASIDALPAQTPDLIRWQGECWDGTGYPDNLRWHAIPQRAQFLALADLYARTEDPEETLGAIGLQSGRAFSPPAARIFTMWFHANAGAAALRPIPWESLADTTRADELFDDIADRIDAHNGVAGRWRRIQRIAASTGHALQCDGVILRDLEIASRVYGAGELASTSVESSQFDALARLGIDDRARHALYAGELCAQVPSLHNAGATVAMRGEWYDGTGKPHGVTHGAIPIAARILSAAIACDALDRAQRLETAAGTQFDPHVVRALLAAEGARA